MKTSLAAVILLAAPALLSGCATPREDLPTWESDRTEGLLHAERALLIQALILEVPARGLTEPQIGPLDVSALHAVMRQPGVQILQSPSLLASPGEPASLFIGETAAAVGVTTPAEQVGLRLAFTQPEGRPLRGDFSLTALRDGVPYQAAQASFELNVGDPPLLLELPGKRYVQTGDELTEEARVFLVVVQARDSH